ncbi:ATP-binding protein [Agrococcus sp. HG114]|uniref:ATP-binding protein n=1 Tax=Agrococcus sp. HG114 TaxID=2969757 RepID=UPI00215B3B21|nr:ATP-binding protein [Agrococcus sp. HG114]MCR8670794.1 ATP-binding protein [Agrococcus sp. HG114]
MRHIEAAEAVRKVGLRKYSSRLDWLNLTLTSEAGKAIDVSLRFSAGIGVVTGGNGAGKTTLLRALRSLQDESEAWPSRLVGLKAGGVHDGADWHVEFERSPSQVSPSLISVAGTRPPLLVIDPAEETQRIRTRFEHDPNAADLLEGTDPRAFDAEMVAHASRVVGRDYSSIDVYEIEGDDGESSEPWFKIRVDGVVYDALGAGRGELSALYLLWHLSRAEANSIVVIDEPEAWLAPASQARLKEVLAFFSAENAIHFVLSTHSPEMYLGLDNAPVSIVEALPSPRAHAQMSSFAAARALGTPLRPAIVMFTEDRLARELLIAILREVDSLLVEAVEVFQSRDGESALLQVQQQFLDGDMERRRIRLAVVLDGDQRRMQKGQRVKRDERLYLPGNAAPEAVLRATVSPIVHRASDDALRTAGVTDAIQFRQSLARAAGLDHHDWFVEVSKEFSSASAACSALVRLCLSDHDFDTDSRELTERIRVLVVRSA